MTKREMKNVAASVRQKLLNQAKQSARPFNELLQYYAMERFLYRLSRSVHGRKFILKGALMFNVWGPRGTRPTMDIDLLGKTNNNQDNVSAVVKDVCALEVIPDGLTFDTGSMVITAINEIAEYPGVRTRFLAYLGTARVTLQIDIGFGDAMYPKPEMFSYPTLLDFPAPKMLGYCRETAIAEKFEAMVSLEYLNSRMKDFYDIWLLSRQYAFDGRILSEAITKTFEHRGADFNVGPVVFKPVFSSDAKKATQWLAFIKRSELIDAPEDFKTVVAKVTSFLKPIFKTLSRGASFDKRWKPSGSWQ